MSFQRFKQQHDEDLRGIVEAIGVARDRLVFAAERGVKERTPVDTGFARNSWFTEVGDGATRSDNGGSGGPDAAQVLGGAQAFDAVTIANGASYIGRLEDGHSQQAPRGMVSVTIADLESRFRVIRNA